MKWPSGQYSIIYADPPWHYNDRRKNQGGAVSHYPLMKTKDICALPVADLAADPCVLFLWATFPNLEAALEVIRAWGFQYKTLGFNWLKLNKDGSPFFGIGHYAKSNAEVCLMAARGNVHSMVQSNHVSSVVITQRSVHSKKPAEVRDRIVELFGDRNRIELFARERVEGWDAWGNEI